MVLLMLIAVALGLIVTALLLHVTIDTANQHHEHEQVCHEDEACFDCRTMGNRICGPGGEAHE